MRASYTASDRVHSTLQKAVKDGNVLEKIKAFEMQAAAAQAESTSKLGGGVSNIINNRMQIVTSSIQSTAQRALSPAMVQPIQHPISPMPIQQELQQQQQQQYIRSHQGRYVHPVQHRHDGHLGPIIGRESRKGAHVLEPARGDIILRRRTPSQKTGNDEDYSIAAITSLALTPSQGHHHHHRASVSRSRHRQETVPDKRSSSQHDNIHKKHQQKRKQKQKETTTSSSNKTSTRRRWLKGRKETPTETATENSKQDVSANKSSKKNKNKKKNTEKEKLESTKKATSPEPKGKTSDNNRVYGVPNTTVNEQTKTEANSPSPPPPPRIDEENESDREEEERKNTETETNHTSPKEEEITQHKECDTITTTNVERRPSKTKYHQKLSSTDGEVISKIDEDTRFVG